MNKVARAQTASIISRLVMEEGQHAQEVNVNFGGLGNFLPAMLPPYFKVYCEPPATMNKVARAQTAVIMPRLVMEEYHIHKNGERRNESLDLHQTLDVTSSNLLLIFLSHSRPFVMCPSRVSL
jgi:hypothetical protein